MPHPWQGNYWYEWYPKSVAELWKLSISSLSRYPQQDMPRRLSQCCCSHSSYTSSLIQIPGINDKALGRSINHVELGDTHHASLRKQQWESPRNRQYYVGVGRVASSVTGRKVGHVTLQVTNWLVEPCWTPTVAITGVCQVSVPLAEVLFFESPQPCLAWCTIYPR